MKFEEYEEEIYNWIIFNRKLKLPITIYAIDKKFRDLNSDFETDKINTRITRIYIFMRRYNLSIRKPTHVGRFIHQNIIYEVTKFYKNLRPDLYDLKFDKDLINNMDETPVFLNMNINGVVDKIGNKQIIVKSQNQEKCRVSVLLIILANGNKLAPFAIFKGNKDSPNIRKELNALDIVKKGKIFYEIN